MRKPEQLPRSHQVMLFWSGLRGAVAFALAAGLTGESGPAMRTTILVVVVLTVLIFGGTTNRMLQILGIRTGVKEHSDTSSTEEEDDEEYARRRLRSRRGKARLNSEDSDQRALLEEDSDNDFDDLPRSSTHYRPDERDTSEQSIGSLLSGPIGRPITEDLPHWFLSFDNKYLKPFFTKRHVHDRNKSIAEYWKAKRRKMERSQGNIMNSFANMDFTSSPYETDDIADNNSAVSMNAVSTRDKKDSVDLDIPPSPSSNIIIGSGRVFGRSTTSSPSYSSPQKSTTPNPPNDARSKRDGPIHLRNT